MHWEPTRQIVVLKFSKPCLFGLVMELAYVSDSKSEFCGFESHPGHQNYIRLCSSAVERLTVYQDVAGSNPARVAISILFASFFNALPISGPNVSKLGPVLPLSSVGRARDC